MITLEEMTRRRDHWRREAGLLGEQLRDLQARYDQEVPGLVAKLERESARRSTAQLEADANLRWVRALQQTVARLEHELGLPGA